jgi:hypothetical protein
MISSLFLQRPQIDKGKTHLLRLSIMRILPKAAIQVEKAIQGEAFTFQMLFQENRQDSPNYNDL